MEVYREILIESFSKFRGTIISGGTTSGIAKIAADIGEHYSDVITTIGYIPMNVEFDNRYSYIVTTDGHDFSMVEPLQMWRDIVLAGCKPDEVKLIGVNGGIISAGEYRLACGMGARVGLIHGSGRAVFELLSHPAWKEMVISLDPIPEKIKNFINGNI